MSSPAPTGGAKVLPLFYLVNWSVVAVVQSVLAHELRQRAVNGARKYEQHIGKSWGRQHLYAITGAMMNGRRLLIARTRRLAACMASQVRFRWRKSDEIDKRATPPLDLPNNSMPLVQRARNKQFAHCRGWLPKRFDVITNSGHRRTSVPYILIRKYILRNTSSPLSCTQRNLAA